MDYEKKYKEALERARANYKADKEMGFLENCDMLELIFPELKESEDERIRKMCIAAVNIAASADGGLLHSEASECLAWLEKQKEPTTEELYAEAGTTEKEYIANTMKQVRAFREKQKEQKEQKPVEKKITLTGFEETLNTFLFDFANSPIEDCEPKEYIKKHSAEILKAAYTELNAQLKQDIFEARQEGIRDGYEVAKAEQKSAEWSEEDEDMLNSCISSIEEAKENRYAYKETDGDTSYDREINWLKSLHPSWKPSEGQMKALYNFAYTEFFGDGDCDALRSLYEDLKKLM